MCVWGREIQGVWGLASGCMRKNRLQGIAEGMSDGGDLLNKAPVSLPLSRARPAQKSKEQIQRYDFLLTSPTHFFSVHFTHPSSNFYSSPSDGRYWHRQTVCACEPSVSPACREPVRGRVGWRFDAVFFLALPARCGLQPLWNLDLCKCSQMHGGSVEQWLVLLDLVCVKDHREKQKLVFQSFSLIHIGHKQSPYSNHTE